MQSEDSESNYSQIRSNNSASTSFPVEPLEVEEELLLAREQIKLLESQLKEKRITNREAIGTTQAIRKLFCTVINSSFTCTRFALEWH